MAQSMAPGLSKVILYEAPLDSASQESAWDVMLNTMANENVAKQISSSWYVIGGVADPIAHQIFQQMAAQGQSFFEASGDDGAYSGLIDFPGDDPYVTVVGGTILSTNQDSTWSSETTWFDSYGVSGGGISTQYDLPAWQSDLYLSNPQVSGSRRNIPDVSIHAGNTYVRVDGQDASGPGCTSAAAPLWAGFAALINQQAAANGAPSVGCLNPVLYLIGKNALYYGRDFHDIADNSNNRSFNAVAGYDLCTGWGTPKGQSLINDILNLRPFTQSVYQYLQDGRTAVDSIAHWESTAFRAYKAPAAFNFYVGDAAVLRGTQKTVSGQKYNNWNNLSDVTNHHIFGVQTRSDQFVSNLAATNNATVQAQFIEGGNPGGYVNFNDPWRIDTIDHFGRRNQGMSDWARTINYSANDVGTSSPDSGVFLNQGFNQGQWRPTLLLSEYSTNAAHNSKWSVLYGPISILGRNKRDISIGYGHHHACGVHKLGRDGCCVL